MILLEIRISLGSSQKTIQFSEKSNLIFSNLNSCGKTTLLRFILYCIGYSVPSLKGLDMDECIVRMKVKRDDGTTAEIFRHGNDGSVNLNGSVESFILPRQSLDFTKTILSIERTDYIPFIPGSMYIDQDKGWSLLNEGNVVGKVKFSVDRLLAIFCKDEIAHMQQKKYALETELRRYNELQNLFDRQKTLENEVKNDIDTEVIETKQAEINSLKIILDQYKKELKRVQSSIKSNNEFKKYIDEMGLLIDIGATEPITLTSKMIVPGEDMDNLLRARSLSLKTKIDEIKTQLTKIERELSQYMKKQNMDEIVESFSVTPLSKIELDTSKVESSIILMKNAIKEYDKSLSSAICESDVAKRLNEIILRNARYLKVDKYVEGRENIYNIHDLKTYSGTDYKKTVLAFRLAYCTLMHEEFNINLPIIIDSPKNEVDDNNIKLMMDLINEFYKDHQVIIASIYKINNDFDKTTELKTENKLLDESSASKLDRFIDA